MNILKQREKQKGFSLKWLRLLVLFFVVVALLFAVYLSLDKSSPIPTALPDKYVRSDIWPPVVQNVSTPYSCSTKPDTGTGRVIIQKKINTRVYCISVSRDAGAGQRYDDYTYTTAYGTGTKQVNFTIAYSSCGGYGSPTDAQYIECQNVVSTFLNSLDSMVDSSMQK